MKQHVWRRSEEETLDGEKLFSERPSSMRSRSQILVTSLEDGKHL